MSALRYVGERFCKNTASVLLVLFSLTACAAERPTPEKPPVAYEPSPIDKVSFTIDAKGNININGTEGLSVKDCSLDPESKDRCSMFDKTIQIEEIQNVFFIRYKGSNCILYGSGSKAKVVCYP
jgi:hypothetical protein